MDFVYPFPTKKIVQYSERNLVSQVDLTLFFGSPRPLSSSFPFLLPRATHPELFPWPPSPHRPPPHPPPNIWFIRSPRVSRSFPFFLQVPGAKICLVLPLFQLGRLNLFEPQLVKLVRFPPVFSTIFIFSDLLQSRHDHWLRSLFKKFFLYHLLFNSGACLICSPSLRELSSYDP